jgi:hypothetical protein
VSGRGKVRSNLSAFIGRVEQKAAGGMLQAVTLGASEASMLTPIATSTLLNSQYREVQKEGTRIVGRVGYTADYALPVHDPENPQNFRRATAEMEFLTMGFQRAEPRIRAALVAALKPDD